MQGSITTSVFGRADTCLLSLSAHTGTVCSVIQFYKINPLFHVLLLAPTALKCYVRLTLHDEQSGTQFDRRGSMETYQLEHLSFGHLQVAPHSQSDLGHTVSIAMLTAEVETDPHVHESPHEHVLVSFEQVQSAHFSQGKSRLEGEAIGGCRETFKLILVGGADG